MPSHNVFVHFGEILVCRWDYGFPFILFGGTAVTSKWQQAGSGKGAGREVQVEGRLT